MHLQDYRLKIGSFFYTRKLKWKKRILHYRRATTTIVDLFVYNRTALNSLIYLLREARYSGYVNYIRIGKKCIRETISKTFRQRDFGRDYVSKPNTMLTIFSTHIFSDILRPYAICIPFVVMFCIWSRSCFTSEI